MVSQLFRLSGFLRLPGFLLLATFLLSALQPQLSHPDRPESPTLFGSKPKNTSRPRALPKAPVDIPIDPVPVPEDAAAEPKSDTEPGSEENSWAMAFRGHDNGVRLKSNITCGAGDFRNRRNLKTAIFVYCGGLGLDPK